MLYFFIFLYCIIQNFYYSFVCNNYGRCDVLMIRGCGCENLRQNRDYDYVRCHYDLRLNLNDIPSIKFYRISMLYRILLKLLTYYQYRASLLHLLLQLNQANIIKFFLKVLDLQDAIAHIERGFKKICITILHHSITS